MFDSIERRKKMIEIEAVEKLKAYIKCQKRSNKGINEDCNSKKCDDCYLCYEQGNSGEHIQSVEKAVQALEKQISKNPYHISQVDDNDNANVECPMCHAKADYAVNMIKKGYCWNCGQLLDWSGSFDNAKLLESEG